MEIDTEISKIKEKIKLVEDCIEKNKNYQESLKNQQEIIERSLMRNEFLIESWNTAYKNSLKRNNKKKIGVENSFFVDMENSVIIHKKIFNNKKKKK